MSYNQAMKHWHNHRKQRYSQPLYFHTELTKKENKMSHTYGRWYNATRKDSLQGLVCSEVTGENIAVTYNPKDAPLVAAAPDLLSTLIDVSQLIPVAPMMHPDDLQSLQSRVLAAIDKAKGE